MADVYLLRHDAPESARTAAAVWLEHHGVDLRHVPPDALITVHRDRGSVESYLVEDGFYVMDGDERLLCDQVFDLHAMFPAEAAEALLVAPVGTGTPP